jgi:hypothetical protein
MYSGAAWIATEIMALNEPGIVADVKKRTKFAGSITGFSSGERKTREVIAQKIKHLISKK